ncbi:MAG TPA: hypothetical protein VIC58_03155 [Actinomycetota bacterium]|jgi:hypothetical protein
MQVVRGEGSGRLDSLDAVPPPDEASLLEPGSEPIPYPLVLVEWHDAWFDFDQPEPEGERADYLVRTVGFLIARGPRFLSVAQEVLPDDDGFRAVTHIPIPVVERVTCLEVAPGWPGPESPGTLRD